MIGSGPGDATVDDIPSPCVGICRIDAATGWCAGCLRTPEEIALWPRADRQLRLEMVGRLRERRRRLGRTSPADSRPRRRRR
jgi:predicted Fe-S protein YdhL (DUF1289 family)